MGFCACPQRCVTFCFKFVFYMLVSYVVSILVTTYHMAHYPVRWRCTDRGPTDNSGLKVVMVSIGQTGTTSIIHALSTMGLRSYHMEDVLTWAPEAVRQNTTNANWARAIRNCGVQAITLEPQLDNLERAIATSPDAVFIQSLRPFKRWVSSSHAGALKDWVQCVHLRWISSSAMAIPWLLIFDAITGIPGRMFEREPERLTFMPKLGQLFTWYSYSKTRMLTPDVNYHHRGSYSLDTEHFEESYDMLFAKTKSAIPPERFYTFDVKTDSWAELARIVGLQPPNGDSTTPFPHPRSSDSFMNDSMATDAFDKFLLCVAIWFGLHVVNWHIFWGFLSLVMSPCRRVADPASGTKRKNKMKTQ